MAPVGEESHSERVDSSASEGLTPTYRLRRALQACAHPRWSLCRRSGKLFAWRENVRTSRHVAAQGRDLTLFGFSILCFFCFFFLG